MIKKIIVYLSMISLFFNIFILSAAAAQTKSITDKTKIAVCMQSATTKKTTALKLAQKTYLTALKQAKGKDDKAKRTDARNSLKLVQKSAKETFTADRKACLSIVQMPASKPSVSQSSTKQESAVIKDKDKEEYTVTYTDTGFSPANLKIKKGENVTFKNKSSQSMWPASGAHPTHLIYPTTGGCIGSTFDACKGVQPGDSWSFKFDILGSWKYHSHLNPSDFGTITVE